MLGANPLQDSSLAGVLANADPHKNLMGHLEANDDWRRENPDAVEALHKASSPGAVNLLRSAGPISDAYMLSTSPISVITGPQGSGKTIASTKKQLIEGQRIHPGADGVRRIKIGAWRQKYDSLWKAAIPSHWKVFPKDLAGSHWTGASPRAAQHRLRFQDRFGEIEIVTDFMAFGDIANPEDLRGLEFTDVYLGEIDTMPYDLVIWLIGRVGRDPPPEITKRQGRIWGDMNAPDVLNWSYAKIYENLPAGWQHFRQPGGMDAGAENLQSYGGNHSYYIQQLMLNADNPWWCRRMVHAIPGVSRATDLVYDKFDETTMLSRVSLKPEPLIPVLVGCDGGLTPAAVYGQEMPDGQLRVLREIALERGGMDELAEQMLVLEARDFRNCEFRTVCDPSMVAGEDSDTDQEHQQRVSKGSDRQRLGKALGRKVELAVSNETARRWASIRAKIALNLGPQRPGYLLDPSCKGLIRGKLQTYQFRKQRGTNDLSSVTPTFDTHVADAEQYVGMECGSDAARKRRSDADAARKTRREEAREIPRRRVFGGQP